MAIVPAINQIPQNFFLFFREKNAKTPHFVVMESLWKWNIAKLFGTTCESWWSAPFALHECLWIIELGIRGPSWGLPIRCILYVRLLKVSALVKHWPCIGTTPPRQRTDVRTLSQGLSVRLPALFGVETNKGKPTMPTPIWCFIYFYWIWSRLSDSW